MPKTNKGKHLAKPWCEHFRTVFDRLPNQEAVDVQEFSKVVTAVSKQKPQKLKTKMEELEPFRKAFLDAESNFKLVVHDTFGHSVAARRTIKVGTTKKSNYQYKLLGYRSQRVIATEVSRVSTKEDEEELVFLDGPFYFMAHSCDANCVKEDGKDGIYVRVVKEIKANELATIDYGNSYFLDKHCLCNSSKCRYPPPKRNTRVRP